VEVMISDRGKIIVKTFMNIFFEKNIRAKVPATAY